MVTFFLLCSLLSTEVYRAGLMVDTSRLTAHSEVSGFTRGETEVFWVRWSSITRLRLLPGWKGVEVVSWLVAAICTCGVSGVSSNLTR